ncbi:hypothetical protein NMY22_g5667 [Coprinellus aureogranulatus]|nr:hypothetical protein NMY22_g5667 [Coprinellus aureogranulatus]
MSRIPSRTSRSPLKPPSSSVTPSTPSRTSRLTPTTPSNRMKPPTARATTPTRRPKSELEESATETRTPALSIKEAIALKRAEAKKAQQSKSGGLGDMTTLEDALPTNNREVEEEPDLLGRLPLRETIEKARSTGTLNLSSRSLPCLPSGLFEIHLNITPDPLKSVVNEPKLPPPEEEPVVRRGGKRNAPAWFEAQDLVVLKAMNNDITEIQHEISYFGSLKTVDLHGNKLTSLPKTFADLSFLTILDLSQNQLTSLPDNLWSLPELTTLNISDNNLRSLPFSAPFQSASKRTGPNSYASTDFFTPAVVRAASPLPKLVNLNASHNRISAAAIDLNIPSSLVKLDLSANPIGKADALLQKLATLPRLAELRFEKAEISDGTVVPDLFSSFTSPPFPQLRLLDFSETSVTLTSVEASFSALTQELDHNFTNDEPGPGVARILVGKRVIKEAWEIELEKRSHERDSVLHRASSLSQGTPASPARSKPQPAPTVRKEVQKETWEIEAEQGLLTEGGKRRARAAAAAREEEERSASSSPTNGASSLSNPKYYNSHTQTLTLPASSPAPKATGMHNRSFSLASSSIASSSASPRTEDLALPAPTLPLSVILAQPFADSLRVLVLTNRRLDRSLAIPHDLPSSGFLPCLEELDLEGCNLDDTVSVHRVAPSEDIISGTIAPTSHEPLLPMITKLFPSLRSLNLSYNRLSDASLTFEALSALILQSPGRNGLRALRLRGNRLSELSGLQKVAELFKGNRAVPEWKMEELDLRDNEVGKLPAELGLLPLDVLLVEGNTFRVPQRRVWEREGTKGLLSWLRGRIE